MRFPTGLTRPLYCYLAGWMLVVTLPVVLGCGGGGGGSTPAVAPQVSVQPNSLTVIAGAPAAFTATATGTIPLTYQWARGGAALAGATAATYALAAAQTGDAGSYTVAVTNAAGTATSGPVVLTVLLAPQVTTQPNNITVFAGSPATFTVTATGSAPLSYQWFRNGGALAGAAGPTLTLASAQLADAGTYTVKVTNAAGAVTSSGAVLTVQPQPIPPVINAFTAAPGTVAPGVGAVLSWDVTGANSLAISGLGTLLAAKGTLNVAPAQTTTYTLTAVNADATVTATATVTVDTTPFAITTLTAPAVIPWGGTAVVSWSLQGLPLSLTLDGVPITGSSTQVAPVRRQSYTLAGSNGTGSDSRTVTIAAQGLALIAGSGAGFGYRDGGPGTGAFGYPMGAAVDLAGNILVADIRNSTIRKIAPDGTVTTLAGVAGQPGSSDGPLASARFNAPGGVAVDAQGTVYVADSGNSTVRRIAGGVVTTLAGIAGQVGSNDGPATTALFGNPEGLALDGAGNVFVADHSGTIRKIDQAGQVSTLAGTAFQPRLVDGQGTTARFLGPYSLILESDGSLTIGDTLAIRRLSPSGAVTTLAGSAWFGAQDGTGAQASFYQIRGMARDGAGNLYVAEAGNQLIRKVTAQGVVTTLAGVAGQAGYVDGTGAAARFKGPQGLAMLPSGTMVVIEAGNALVRTLTTGGTVGTLTGTPVLYGSADGAGALARFNLPLGLALDPAGNTYVADSGNGTIRKMTPGGLVTTLAGSAGAWGSADGQGAAARFGNPQCVAADAAGNLYVADTGNHTVRRITPGGGVTTLAGMVGQGAHRDGAAAQAMFNGPTGVAVGVDGTVYVTDTGNRCIRTILNGTVHTLAGLPGEYGYWDGPGAQAEFAGPTGLAVDATGNVFVADSDNNVIRRIAADGQVTTLAGNPGAPGHADGTGFAAQFDNPRFLGLGPNGDLFVTDGNNATVRRVTPAGKVTTVAGQPGLVQWQPGPLPGTLGVVQGLAVTATGDLLVSIDHAIIQVTAPGP